MMAKIVKYFHPQLVDLHNYVPTCNTDQKLSNWSTFNRKVFHKLCFCISEADICKVVANMPGAMEPILCALRAKVEEGALGGSPASKAPSLLFPHPSVSLAGLQMAFALQSGHGWLALGGPRPWGPAAAGGQGAGSGHLAGDSEAYVPGCPPNSSPSLSRARATDSTCQALCGPLVPGNPPSPSTLQPSRPALAMMSWPPLPPGQHGLCPKPRTTHMGESPNCFTVPDWNRLYSSGFGFLGTSLHSQQQQWRRGPISSHAHQHLLFSAFLIIVFLVDVKWRLLVVLIHISLMINDLSCIYWPSVYILWRNVRPSFLLMFELSCLFVVEL
ncbi:uncharacterized protein LOC126059740 isoform X4 [Elephas maximus indicus]|uniref:uncharacterized protein LOC126059740 isoform X4 n=1 Tax=Elephas maximus indicus TaxID=99487 RepID=UPI002116AD9C|nr:uncharacterized protein LOC126059740 isoform X4 [Elephas maximus indicus]